MLTIIGSETIKAPGSLVFMTYASVPDYNVRVTPDIKQPGRSKLGLIDLGLDKNRLGGSALAQACNQLGNECPDISPDLLKRGFNAVQQMVAEGLLLALHDRSDGGTFIAVAEMCMASNCGFDISVLSSPYSAKLAELFAEECGWVVEYTDATAKRIVEICREQKIKFSWLGLTSLAPECWVRSFDIGDIFYQRIESIRSIWEATSLELEKQQNSLVCVESERKAAAGILDITPNLADAYRLTFKLETTPDEVLNAFEKPKMAVLREEGTNGDAEMRAMFMAGGFDVYDFPMTDLLAGRATLDDVQLVVPAGGFSYMDVFRSAGGWEAVVRFNKQLSEMFDRFYDRPDTLSLGVCNGCQWHALAGWVPWKGIERKRQPRFIQNHSKKFESRWVQVEVLPSPSVLLSGMVGSRLGVWVAHGEGRCYFPDKSIYQEVKKQQLIPLAYVDPLGRITNRYPYNPNGSPDGIAGLCTPDGRHTAIMPHPERGFRLSRSQWSPASWKNPDDVGPWLRIAQNAHKWCLQNK